MHTALIQDGEHGLSVTPNEKAVAEALCHVGEENWESKWYTLREQGST